MSTDVELVSHGPTSSEASPSHHRGTSKDKIALDRGNSLDPYRRDTRDSLLPDTEEEKAIRAVRERRGSDADSLFDPDELPVRIPPLAGKSKLWWIINILIPIACIGVIIAADSSTRDTEKGVMLGDDANGDPLCVYGVSLPSSFATVGQSTASASFSYDGVLDDLTLLDASSDLTRDCSECQKSAGRPLQLKWRVLLSLIPFVVVFQGILSLRLSSRYVAPFSLFVVIYLGMNFFRDADYFAGDSTALALGKVFLSVLDLGIWTLFEYAINVLTAVLLLRVLQLWGVVDRMVRDFQNITDNPNRQIMLVAFGFAMVLTVVAPGGSNFVIAGSILISMNLFNERVGSSEYKQTCMRIAAVCLFGNALTSAWSLLGISILTLGNEIGPLDTNHTRSETEQGKYMAERVAKDFSIFFFIFSVFAPLLVVLLFRPEKGLVAKIRNTASDIPILMSTGLVFAVFQILSTYYMSMELTGLIAGGAAVLFYVLWERFNPMKHQPLDDDHEHSADGADASEPSSPKPQASLWETIKSKSYYLPFILLFVVLLVLNLVPGLNDTLKGGDDDATSELSSILNPHIIDIEVAASLCTNENQPSIRYARRFSYLTHPGFIVALIALITPFIVPYYDSTNDEDVCENGVLLGAETQTVSQYAGRPEKFKEHVTKLAAKLRGVAMFSLHGTQSIGKKRRRVIWSAMSDALVEVAPVLFSITAFASIAKLMGRFEMTQSIAEAISQGIGDNSDVYVVFMPVIGMLGSAISGSTTTSNLLFGSLQITTARQLGIISATANSVSKVGAIQLLGTTCGEIISPMNAVVTTLITGFPADKNESHLLRRVLPMAAIWMGGCIVVSLIFLSGWKDFP